VKPSNADYPVEQEELARQRDRLRKAAAAGVDGLKSPISFLSSLSSPQAALAQSTPSAETNPKPSQPPPPEIPAAQSAEMDPTVPPRSMDLRDAEDQAFLDGCKLTERESIDQFGKTILALTSGALAVSFICLKDIIKPADTANKGCLIGAWVLWSAAMLCTLLSLYASQLASRQAQKRFSRGLRGQDLVEARGVDKLTRSLNPLAGVWFVAGLIFMFVFVGTNLTHENSGTIWNGATNAITSTLSTNGTVFPTGATNTTVP
jgi:hypothetical protein